MSLRPVLNWNIVGGCNYRCSYCVQKHAEGVGGPEPAALDRRVATLAALPGVWEFKLSCGGPRPCPYAICPSTVPQNRGIVSVKMTAQPPDRKEQRHGSAATRS